MASSGNPRNTIGISDRVGLETPEKGLYALVEEARKGLRSKAIKAVPETSTDMGTTLLNPSLWSYPERNLTCNLSTCELFI